MSVGERTITGEVDATLRAHEDGRSVLVAGVLALKELEVDLMAQIGEREAAECARAEVHPLRSAHAALIAARKELVLAEQRAASRLRTYQRQHLG